MVISVNVDAMAQVNVYELLVELLESTGADRLETEDPARLRAGAEAKLAEITEVLLLISSVHCTRALDNVKSACR